MSITQGLIIFAVAVVAVVVDTLSWFHDSTEK
jgi:predicted ribosomally synthesized peptide with SipW-like signal peptide